MVKKQSARFTFAVALLALLFCSRKNDSPLFLTANELTEKHKATITKAGLSAEDSILILFSHGNLEKQAAFITPKGIFSHVDGTIKAATHKDIYDMLHSHSRDTAQISTITVYLFDNTEFVLSFPGSTDFDERFFNMLRDTWLAARKEP